ncbi:hypothetical protein U2088_15505, partial [Listeria monocytogenes]|uniref:hypothetical protein n=1 Tax=Listeria monocytogenes TaxID=1639 RepID=UPI002FDBCAAA
MEGRLERLREEVVSTVQVRPRGDLEVAPGVSYPIPVVPPILGGAQAREANPTPSRVRIQGAIQIALGA